MVILNNVDTMYEAFVKQGSDYSGRPSLYSLQKTTEGGKDIACGDYNETWKFQRKIAMQALRQYLTGTQLQNRINETLQPVIDAMKSEKEAFMPHKYFSLSVFNIIHGLCFGKTMELEDPLFLQMLKGFDDVQENFGNGFIEDFIPPLRLWPTKRLTDTLEAIDIVNVYCHKQLEEHRDNLSLAGFDTSRTTLDWFFLVMATHPKVQDRVHKELDEVIGADTPGREHRSKLVYTEAVLLETMRMYYVVPVGLPHQTLRDTSVAGYDVPAKTTIMTNNSAIMHDERHWEDPYTFKPERFLDKTGTKLIANQKSFIPFSMGHHSCLGESLAKLEILYIIAGIMQELKFSLPPGAKEDFTPSKAGFAFAAPLYKVVLSSRRC